MSIRMTPKLLVYLGLAIAPSQLAGQTAGLTVLPSSPSQPGQEFRPPKALVATYDSLTDSTHLALVTHKGKYLLWMQQPRLTWTIAHPGRTPGSSAPTEIVLMFRTQNPQVPEDNRLIIEFAPGERVEVTSVAAYTHPGPMTSSFFMRFPIPIAELDKALGNERMRLSVGGIRVDFQPDQMEAMRGLLSQAGAWPRVSSAAPDS